MHYKQKALSRAIGAITAGAFTTIGCVAVAQAQQKVEKIEVTGSNIKRVDAETVSPITVLTREDIERSAKATVAEVLRDLPYNGGQSFNETFTNSFSPGGSGIALRGLSQKSTLVLVNGRRMAGYGLAQNLFDTYVDLNSIPTSAVERVEVLRDGASAVYGSDAIAGVINVILRKDFKGVELAATAGTSHEGGLDEQRMSLAAGFGDLSKNRFNVMGVLDYYKRDRLQMSERDFTKNQDFRNREGGTLTRATRAAYYAVNGASNANGRTPLSTCAAEDRIAASTLSAALSGTTCVYNAAPYLTLFPETERLGFLGRGSFEFTPTLSAFGEFNYSKNESNQTFTPAQVANGTGLLVFNPVTGGVRSISNRLAANNPSNPFGVPVNILYSFFDVGGRDTTVETEATRALGGLKWTFGSWDFEAAVGGAKSETTSTDLNGINADVLNTAIANGTYNFLNPSAGTITANDLRINQVRKSESELTFADIKTFSEIYQLPAGPVGFAAGFDYRKESLDDIPDEALAAGRVLGRGFTRTQGERNSKAAYVEFAIPVTKQLEVQLAARRDKYSDFGSATSPKWGFKWAPNKEFLVRGSVSKGFRAPTLPEATQTNALSFTTVVDPLIGAAANIAQLSVSNPGLKPERSKSENLGVVFEPFTDFNVGIDFYKIIQNDLVTRDGNAFIIAQAIAGNPFFVNRVVRDPATNAIIYTIRQVRNLDYIETSGIDLDMRKTFRGGDWGKFTVSTNWNYVRNFKLPATGPGSPYTDTTDSNAFGSIPRYKGNVGMTWEKNVWTTALTYRYIHGYDQAFAPPAGAVGRQFYVGSYYDYDLFVSWSGIKNLKITGSVRNLLDHEPSWDSSSGSIGVDFTQYDHRGRYFTLGATYSFK
jgi:iron complex outermembrane receptor protein